MELESGREGGKLINRHGHECDRVSDGVKAWEQGNGFRPAPPAGNVCSRQ